MINWWKKEQPRLLVQNGFDSFVKFLLFARGKEPNYFLAFPENPKVYSDIDVRGPGYNTISLVKEAIRIKEEAWKNRVPYQEVWCVFDRDSFPLESFNEAIALARSEKIRCVYSIEAFEIWYLLHFNYYDAALSRTQYKDKLTALLGTEYLKNDTKMYERLQE
ncbi:MAG: RloB family protein, partial [Treponema sp.]|nr:RloB family protein [Treponema sp.]